MESNQVRQLELRSRALELEMRQRRVEMGRMQVELREADARLRRSSERFGDIKQQLLSVQESRSRSGSPAEVLYQAKNLAEQLTRAAKVVREHDDAVSAMRGKLAESQRHVALREVQLQKLDERAQAITERVAQGIERTQSEEVAEISSQVQTLGADRRVYGMGQSGVGLLALSGEGAVGKAITAGGVALENADLKVLGVGDLLEPTELGGADEGALLAELGDSDEVTAPGGTLGERLELVHLRAGEPREEAKVVSKRHLREGDESATEVTSGQAEFGASAQVSSAQLQLQAIAQAGMDMQRQQNGQHLRQSNAGSVAGAAESGHSFREAVSPGLEKQVELLQSWDKLSGQGVGFAVKLDSGKSLGVEISAGPAGGVKVVLEPENNRDRHSLWQQRKEIIEALEEAGCEVKGVTVRGRQ